MTKLWLLLLFVFVHNVNPQPPVPSGMFTKVDDMISMLKGEDILRYDCSGKTIDQWYQMGQTNVPLGLYYIIIGVLLMLLGILIVAIFLLRIKMKDWLSVYRIMALMAVIGVVELTGNSIWPGIVVLKGNVYCTSQTATTFFGKLTMVTWLTGSGLAVFLGINRLIDLSQYGDILKKVEHKTTIFFAIFIIYGLFGSMFFDTVLYNSVYMAPWLNPMTGLPDEYYSNNFLRFHNIISSGLLYLIYGSIFVIYMVRDKQVSSKFVTTFQKNILLQSVWISSTYAIPAMMFVTMYALPDPPKWFIFMADIAYQLSAGIPFIMYLVLNKQVRIELLKILRIYKAYTAKHSATVATITQSSCVVIIN